MKALKRASKNYQGLRCTIFGTLRHALRHVSFEEQFAFSNFLMRVDGDKEGTLRKNVMQWYLFHERMNNFMGSKKL